MGENIKTMKDIRLKIWLLYLHSLMYLVVSNKKQSLDKNQYNYLRLLDVIQLQGFKDKAFFA